MSHLCTLTRKFDEKRCQKKSLSQNTASKNKEGRIKKAQICHKLLNVCSEKRHSIAGTLMLTSFVDQESHFLNTLVVSPQSAIFRTFLR